MLEDCYLCECNIELSMRMKDRIWSAIYAEKSIDFVNANAFRIAYYNDVIEYNSIMMLTHGDFNYAE